MLFRDLLVQLYLTLRSGIIFVHMRKNTTIIKKNFRGRKGKLNKFEVILRDKFDWNQIKLVMQWFSEMTSHHWNT